MKRSRLPIAPTVFILLIMLPVYWLVTLSLKSYAEIAGSLSLYPHAPSLDTYQRIFTDPAWYMGYYNALVYVLFNLVITLLVSVPAAYAFSRYQFRGARLLFFGLLSFRMISPAILLVPMVQIFSDLHLIDTYIAVALAHCFFNVPIAVWILEGFISAIPKELDELARIDGYPLFTFIRRVLIPQIAPGIAVTAFFCFMFSWVEFLLANALTTIHAKPISGVMTQVASLLSANIPQLAAAGVLMWIPGVIFIYFVRKHLARGFSMGRVS